MVANVPRWLVVGADAIHSRPCGWERRRLEGATPDYITISERRILVIGAVWTLQGRRVVSAVDVLVYCIRN